MQTSFTLNQGVRLSASISSDAIAVTDEQYRDLMACEERHLMTEANTMADLESTFFYDVPLHIEEGQIMEAITTSRMQLARTMKAFVRALSQKLNGTNIQVGSTKTGGASQDGVSVIGGADIGRTRNVNGLPIMPAIVPASDGQTISILFHSPTADVKIKQSDTLVAFQFLLNKKDVTHTVAPMGGQDISLAQVTMKLANLLEKNSGKFQRAQKKQKALADEIAQLQADSDSKEIAIQDASDHADSANDQATTLSQQLNEIISEADALDAENTSLQSQIDELTKSGGRGAGDLDPVPVTPSDPEPVPLPPTGSEPPTEADINAGRAIDFLKGIGGFSSTDLDEINSMIVKVQEAAQALIAAGVFDENEGLVNIAADHLIGLLITIQNGGVANVD